MKKYIAILALVVLGLAVGIRAQESAPDDNNQAPSAERAPTPPLPEQQAPPPEAQPTSPSQANGQVPANGQVQNGDAGPGVARVSLIQGNLSTQHGENSAWEAATLNTPVLPGDRISTGGNSRAEVQIDYANVLRMDQNSTAKVADVTRSRVLLQVSQGLVNFNILRGNAPPAEIDTPNVAVRPSQQGSYRIEVDSDSETKVTVRSGSADVSTPQGSVHVNNGQMIEVQGTDTPQYQVVDAPAKDGWDDFNNERDHKFISAQSWSHTDPYYTGTQDMDGYGEWSEIPDYGPVWTPTVAPGWAPYRDGRWVYEPYWGWTWVSYEPWGWAPYHYGRWFMHGGNWAWWPGPVVGYPGYYPIWAPAYVSFFGFGRGWGVGFGFGFGGWGTIGWLPIGPGDYFRPWWGGWGARSTFIGVGGLAGFHDGFAPLFRGARGFSNLNSAMTNERLRAGMTAMRGDEFGRSAVAGHMERVDASTFRQGSMLGGRMAITPTRASYQSVDRAASPGTIRGYTAGHFFSAGQAPNRTLTARAGMEAQGGLRSGANQSFGNRGTDSRFAGNAATNSGRSFSQNGAQSTQNGAADRQGWHSFGEQNNSSRGGFGNGGRQGAVNSNSDYGRPNGSRASPSPSPSNGGRSYQGYGGARSNSYSGGGSSRPPLNMRQPIVTPRSYGSYGNESRSYGGGSYSRGSAPSYRGGGGASRGGGGGSSRGGGGSRSGGRSGGSRR